MKEADKRARITVAYGGLALLKKQLSENPNYKSTRAHLFAMPKGEEKNLEIVKALKTKDWQKDYLQRLIDAELLVKVSENGQELYYPSNIDEIGKIIEDHDNWGLRLSKFLFPREAGIPNELAEDDAEEQDDEGGLPKPEPNLAEKDDSESILKMSEQSVKAMVKLLGRIQELLTMNLEMMKLTAEQHKTVDLALRGTQELLEKDQELTQAEQEFPRYVKNQFKELENRLSKLEESASTGARTLARLDAGITALSANLGTLVPKISSLLGLTEGQTLMSQLGPILREALGNLKQTGSIRDVLAELRAKIKDLSAVEDLAMKAVESIEQGEVTNER